MSVRTRDWLKFISLVGIAFVVGLAFASALNLPRNGRAAEVGAILAQTAAPRVPLHRVSPKDRGNAVAAGAVGADAAAGPQRSQRWLERSRAINRQTRPRRM